MTIPTILFVDDEPKVHDGIRRTLRHRQNSWQLLFASDGAQALDMVLTQPVHVVVTDIAMPGMDGEGLIRHLYDEFPDLAIIILSGYWTPPVSKARVGPGIRFLPKPTTPQHLETAIAAAIADMRLIELALPPEHHLAINRPSEDGAPADWVAKLDSDPGL
mgnify:CR=1 FL=1